MPVSHTKLLIVEDETNIRNLIRATVDWDGLGIKIVGEAATGLEAIDLIEEFRPDIVLTDIEMPYMDGLELSHRILQRYSGISVIILTAHDQFDYAQQALKIGVSNYILKPIDQKKIEETLRAAIGQIAQRRNRLSEMEMSHSYVQNHRRFFRDRSLEEMIHKGRSEGLEEFLNMVGVRFSQDALFSLALMTVSKGDASCPAADRYLWLSNCRSYIEEQYAPGKQLWVFWDRMEALVLLCADPALDFTLLCQQMMEDIEENMRCHVHVGLGAAAKTVDQLPMIYRGARDALRLAMLAGKTVLYTHAAFSMDGDQKSLERNLRDLILYVKNGMGDKVTGVGRALLNQAASQRGGDLNAAKMFAMHVLTAAINESAEAGIPSRMLMTNIASVFEKFLGFSTMAEVAALLEEQLVSLSNIAAERQRDHSNHMVTGVLRYVEENYGNADLSLSYVADRFSINSSYLSRIFKADTGKPFSEYLIDLRVNIAKQMLQTNAYKAYQLAQFVGIPDPGYFTKCFRKVTGVSFQAYKAALKGDE